MANPNGHLTAICDYLVSDEMLRIDSCKADKFRGVSCNWLTDRCQNKCLRQNLI